MQKQTNGGAILDAFAYEGLVRSVVDYAIYTIDPDGCVSSWNAGAERIKGYTAEEIIGLHFSCFHTAEDREAGQPEQALRAASEEGRHLAEGWRVRKDGSRFWAMAVMEPIREDGRLVGFAAITRDMTSQREASLAAVETNRRFELLVQSVTDYAIYMLDPQGRVSSWNTGAQRIKGYTAGEIVGKHFARFYTPEDREAGIPWKALATAEREGRFTAEGWRQRKDGTQFWASVVIDAIRDDEGVLIGFAKVTRDLTERREAELELQRSQQTLFQAQKMEAVGQLTGGLAHDFNNLLTGITGSLDLMKAKLAKGRIADLDRYISAAQGAAARAAALTRRLLAFSRQQALEPKATNANRLIDGMKELLRQTLGPAIVVETMLVDDSWACFCDPNQLENAILNLCINSRDAMPGGGRITIRTANVTIDRVSAGPDAEPGEYTAIGVIDSGSGMPPEVVSRAFDPFFTTKLPGKGTGLGLSMTYGFAKQSRGHVRIQSEVGKGTTVTIYLPRHAGHASEGEAEKTPDECPRTSSGETILVVDDEATVRMLVAETLSDFGFHVIEAEDGASGLEALASGQQIDLLITDVGLPGEMDGRQMAARARADRPGLKVLFMTGYVESAAALPDARSRLLNKPFTADRLAVRVRAALDEP